MNPLELNVSTRISAIKPIESIADSAKANKQVQNKEKTETPVEEKTAKQAEAISFSQNDIVSISEDGDTVQASKAGINASGTKGILVSASEDGAVTQVSDDKGEREIDSLAGYTKSQVEQLYREGRISRYEYDQNMENRKKREEALEERNENKDLAKLQEDSLNNFAKDMGKINSKAMNVNNANEGIASALDNNRINIVGDIFTQQ